MELERLRNEELKAEVKEKDELLEMFNKQLVVIPELKVELEEKKEEIQRGQEMKKEKESLINQMNVKDKELKLLRGEIDKLEFEANCLKVRLVAYSFDHFSFLHLVRAEAAAGGFDKVHLGEECQEPFTSDQSKQD